MKQINQTIVDNLLLNLEKFYKQLYINELKSRFFTILLALLSGVLVVSALFFYLELNILTRYLVFYISFLAFIIVLFWAGILPALKYFDISGRLSVADASKIVGFHFKEIDDKLLNTIELINGPIAHDIVEADIVNRSKFLLDFDFTKAVVSVNWRMVFLPFLFVLVIVSSVAIVNPEIYKKGVVRFLSPSVDYSNATFDFVVLESDTLVSKGSDVVIKCRLVGTDIPDMLFVKINGVVQQVKVINGEVRYDISNVRANVSYSFSDGVHHSRDSFIKVVDNSNVWIDSVVVISPEYSGLVDRTEFDFGQMSLLKGSEIKIYGSSYLVNSLTFDTNVSEVRNDKFTQTLIVNNSWNLVVNYTSIIGGSYEKNLGSISMIADESPLLSVLRDDSLGVFILECHDDYGFTSLNYRGSLGVINLELPRGKHGSILVPQSELLNFGNGYFELCDNNGIEGFSCVNSDIFVFESYSDMERLSELNANSQAISSNSVPSSSGDKDELLFALKELKSHLRELEENDQVGVKLPENSSDRLTRKARQLDELNGLLQEERVEKLLKEIDKVLKDLNSESLEKQLKDIEKNKLQLEQDLERNLELYEEFLKELELEAFSTDLDEFVEYQERLLLDEDLVTDSLTDLGLELEQKALELDSLLDNEESNSDEMKDINEDLNDATNDESDSESTKSKQKDALEKSKKLQEKIGESILQMKSSTAEDAESLRKILENLKRMSLEQESVYSMGLLDIDGSFYRKQLVVANSFDIISDSLNSLAKRVPMIGDKVYSEVGYINNGLNGFELNYSTAEVGKLQIDQRRVLTSVNELAVLLDDIINSLQEQLGESGQGSCSKPGAGKPKPGKGDSDEKMKALKSNMNKLSKQLGKSGKGSKTGPSGLPSEKESMELSELMLQNELTRAKLNELLKDIPSGSGTSNSLKELDQLLDSQQRDLINGDLDELQNRLNEILTKFLECEKSYSEDEWDSKRESTSSNSVGNSENRELDEYIRKKRLELELLRKDVYHYNGYYRLKYL